VDRYYHSQSCKLRKSACHHGCLMTSIADSSAEPAVSDAAALAKDGAPFGGGRRAGDCAARGRRARIAASICFAAGAVADLHRSSAAQYPDLVHAPQLRDFPTPPRSSSSSPATTAAFVYGRAHAGGGLCGGDRAHPAPGLADLRRARVPVHDLPRRDFLRRHLIRRTRSTPKRWASWIFSSSRMSPSSRRCC